MNFYQLNTQIQRNIMSYKLLARQEELLKCFSILDESSPTPRSPNDWKIFLHYDWTYLTQLFQGDFFLTSRCHPPVWRRVRKLSSAQHEMKKLWLLEHLDPLGKRRKKVTQDFSVETRTREFPHPLLWNLNLWCLNQPHSKNILWYRCYALCSWLLGMAKEYSTFGEWLVEQQCEHWPRQQLPYEPLMAPL
jgi:hypothetical protein